MNKHERRKNGPLSTTLRERGFIPLPRLWVKREDMPHIHKITRQYEDEVNEVRASIRHEIEQDQAWQELEKRRQSG